ncbi:MAG: hypothetical protein WCS92_03350 [Candidatus Babeliales bacterium]
MKCNQFVSSFFRFTLILIFLINHANAGLKFSNQNSKLALQSGSTLGIGSPIQSWEGTLEKKSGATISGSSVTFNNGYLNYDTSKSEFSGIFDPNATQQIQLNGNKILSVDKGTFLNKINVVGTGNKIQGTPQFSNADGIRLENNLSSVTLALQNVLNSDIALRGGSLILANDLNFADDRTLTGSGTVFLKNNSLSFGSKTDLKLTHTILWDNSTDINLTSKTSLSGTWNFTGNSSLNGHGNILDLTSGGTIYVKKDATLNLTDVVIKGIGITNGWFVFQDQTSKINMSNVTVELDNRFTVSTGGIYVEGPTTFELKNYNWTIDQNASMTVDGVTLWKDPLDQTNYGKIQLGSGSASKYLSLVSSGTIKTLSNLDIIQTSTTNLQQQITNNSNAIIKLDTTVRTNSNAFAYGIKNNSNTLLALNRTTSNALLFGDRNNSNAIVLLDRKVRVNSNAMLYLNRTTSNALLFGDRNNSNAIVLLDRKVRVNSNAMLYLNRTTSNALLFGDRNNSNAIITLDRTVRTNSNAFAYGIKNNSNTLLALNRTTSNALLFGDRNNSNAIITLDRTVRTNSNAFAYGIKNNSNTLLALNRTTSNALLFGDRNNSNAIVLLDRKVRVNSNAMLYLNRTTSNALLFGDRNNSNAIITLDRTVRTNSNAFAYGIKNNSNTLLALNRTTSNALLFGDRNNSNAIVLLDRKVRVNSNAMLYLNRTTSNALLFGDRNNSNAIITLDRTVRTDSNAFAYGIKNNSNAILMGSSELAVQNSNALLALTRDNSNALLYGIRNNSNAIIKLSGVAPAVLPINNSNAIVSWIKQTSDTLNWLNTIVRTDSNAFAYGIKNNSNAILKGSSDLSINNSNAIIKLVTTVRTDSNAFAYGIKNNSNAILMGSPTLAIENSNAIVSWIKDTSNAVNWTSPLVSGNVYYNVTMNQSIFVNSDQIVNITNPAGVIVDGQGQTVIFDNFSSPQFIIQENVPVTLQNITLANINQNTFNIKEGGQVLIGPNTTFEFTENVTLSTGTFNVLDSPEGTVCTFVSLSGNNVVTYNEEAILNLGDNTLRLENIELGSVTNINYGTNNLIELATDASVDVDGEVGDPIGLNFTAIGENNALTLMGDNLTLSGLITFGDAAVNELAIRFVLENGLDPERVIAGEIYPIVNFTGAPGIMLGGSPINVARLVLENPYTILNLLDSNALLLDQNGQIFFTELELRQNNIKQYSANVLIDGTQIIGHQIDPSFIRAYSLNQNYKQSYTYKPTSKTKTKIQVQPKIAKVKEKIEKSKVSDTPNVTAKPKTTPKNTKTNFKDKTLKIKHMIAKNRKGIEELNEILGIDTSKDDSLLEEIDCLCDDSNN